MAPMDFKHFSHNHPLVFHQVPEGSKIHCSGCKSPGSGNIYACWQCSYFLHEQCYHAKRFLDHLSHAVHPLTLVPYPTYPSGKFVCKSCNLEGNGMCYTCSKCHIDMHVQCAVSPNSNAQASSFPVRNDAHNYSTHLQASVHPSYANNTQNFSPQSQTYPYPPTQNNVYPNSSHSGSNNQHNHFRPLYAQNNTSTPNYYPPVNSTYPNPPPQYATGGSNNPSIQFPSYTQLNRPPLNSNPTNDARYQNPPPQPTSTNSTNNPPPLPPYYPTAESQSTNTPSNTQNFSHSPQNPAYPPTQNNAYPNFPHHVGTSGLNYQNNKFPPPSIQSITPMTNHNPSVNPPYPNPPTQPTTELNDTNKHGNHVPSPRPQPNTPTKDNTIVNTPYPNSPPQPTGTSPAYSTEVSANTTTNDPPLAPPSPDYNPQVSSPYPNPPPQHTTGGFNNQSGQFPSYTQTNNHSNNNPPNSNPMTDAPYPNPPSQSTPFNSTPVDSTSTTNNSPPPLHYPSAETQNFNNPQNVGTSGLNNQNQYPPPHNNVYPSFSHNVGTDGSNNQNHFRPPSNSVYPSFPNNVGTIGSNNQNNRFPPPYIQSNTDVPNHNPPINSAYPNPLPQPTTGIDASVEQKSMFSSPDSQTNTPTSNDNTTVEAPNSNPPSQPVPTIPIHSIVTNTTNNNPPQAPPTHNPQANSPYPYPPPQYTTGDLNNQSVQFPSHTQTNEQPKSNLMVDASYPNPPPKSAPTNGTAVTPITTTTNSSQPPPLYYPTAESRNPNNHQNVGTGDYNQNHIPPSHNNAYPSFPHNVDGSNYQNSQACPPYIQSNMHIPNHNSPVYSPYPNPPPQPTIGIDISNEQNKLLSPHPQPYTPVPNDNTTFNSRYYTPPPQHISTIPPYSIAMNTSTATTSNNPPETPPPHYPTPEPHTINNPQMEPPSLIQHFSHPHTLKQLEINKKSGKICSACDNKLSHSSFVCTEPHCSFNLHKACFDSPQEIRHKSHSSHPLTLVTTSKYEDGMFTCDACCKDGKGFAYSCAPCSYDLHMNCVSLPKKKTRPDHKHALTLYYSSPVGKDATLFCDVCDESVHESAWMYYCQLCDFGTHLECVESEIKPQNAISSVASDMDELYATAISGRIAAETQQAALDLWD